MVVGGCETSGDTASSSSGTGSTGSTGSTNSGSTSSLDCDTTTDWPTGVAPVLDPCHDGWKQAYCEQGCHEVPQPDHLPDPVPSCGSCHGGNGACTPIDPNYEHVPSDDCIACHVESHDFTLAEQCVMCHFASQGVVDCP